MRSLENNAGRTTLLSAATGSPSIPPAPSASAVVPTWWNAAAGAMPEFELRASADGTTNLTLATLYAGILMPAAPAALTGVADMAATKASLDMATVTADSDAVIEAKVAGSAGNATRVRFVPGSLVNVGALDETAFPDETFNYKSATTTEANYEAAVTASAHLDVKTPGTGGHVLADPGDTFGFTNLAGGYDANTLVKVAHGLMTGDGPFKLTKTAGANPAGLAEATDYWAIRIDADHFKIAASLSDALAGTAVAFTGGGADAWTATPDGSFQSVLWHVHSLLGIAADGAVPLTVSKGYCKFGLRHSPDVVAYAISATSSDTTKHLSVSLGPLREL